MSNRTVIRVEDIGKQYCLGIVNHATLQQDLQSWWARMRGQEDPNLRIDAQDVSLTRYDKRFWALRDVSFNVSEGDILGIIGRNGAGKSTLLKILSQVTTPTKGQIKIHGRIASLLEVGTGFHPELTGRENIFLNGAILGMNKAEITSKIESIVDFSEVEKFIDTPVKRYSSGMYVRLAFAVAAHLETEILVVDEVLAVGDIQFQKKCLGKMSEVSKEGRTILFVSHNMSAVQQLCTRAILLEDGRIVQDGNVEVVVQKYFLGFESLSAIGISSRKDRNGKGRVRFVDVFLENNQQERINSIPIGSDISFIFKTNCKATNMQCKFTIYNSRNIALSHFESDSTSHAQILKCKVIGLTLSPGKYRINAALYTFGELQDHLESVLFFDIDGAVLCGCPRYQQNRYSLVIFPSEWA